MTSPLILNVDDNEAALYAKSRLLRQAGYDVAEARNGADAIELARTRKPNLVLLDIKMPDMLGYEVCRRIKALFDTTSVLVVHISATFADGAARVRGLDSGADGYLAEPVDPTELLATIRAFLRLQRAEEALRESESKYRTLMESLADGVFVAQGGRFQFANDELPSMLGYSPKEFIGLAFDDVVAPEFLLLWNERLAERIDTGLPTEAYEVRLLRHQGDEPLWVEVRASRITFGGDPAVLGILRDITDRKRMEHALRDRTNELVARDRYKDEFLAMLSHELRNPLAPLTNALALLRSGKLDKPQTMEVLNMMSRQLEHLLRLVNDLLDASRVTRGMIQLETAPVDLKLALTQAVEGARAQIVAQQHRFEASPMPDQPLVVNGDLTRLGQVFVNILNNAAKYTPPGGTIRMSVTRENGHAVVRVRDTGRGIPAEFIPKIFDLFMQVDRTLDRSQGGLGIGLTLVQRLVRAHGGDVLVESEGAGKGSEFTVRLPLLRAAAAAPRVPESIASSPVSRRVVVVDDNADVVSTYVALLRQLGHEVRSVSDSSQVADLVDEFAPDIVFMDIGMPGLDGLEVTKRIREAHPHDRLRIIAVTGYGDARTRELARAAGFDEVLVKPADLATIQQMIASLP